MENEIYKILKKHKLPLKKREEVLTDLLLLFSVAPRSYGIVRCYQIDFGNHLRCKIKVTDNGIEVEGAINGWGDGVPLSEVVIIEAQ